MPKAISFHLDPHPLTNSHGKIKIGLLIHLELMCKSSPALELPIWVAESVLGVTLHLFFSYFLLHSRGIDPTEYASINILYRKLHLLSESRRKPKALGKAARTSGQKYSQMGLGFIGNRPLANYSPLMVGEGKGPL